MQTYGNLRDTDVVLVHEDNYSLGDSYFLDLYSLLIYDEYPDNSNLGVSGWNLLTGWEALPVLDEFQKRRKI